MKTLNGSKVHNWRRIRDYKTHVHELGIRHCTGRTTGGSSGHQAYVQRKKMF